jgi:hypothetical protein
VSENDLWKGARARYRACRKAAEVLGVLLAVSELHPVPSKEAIDEAFNQRYGRSADLIDAQRKINENHDAFRAMRKTQQRLAMYEREP